MTIRTKPRRSLRENALPVIPPLFDGMMARAGRVEGHPLRRDDLHAMRIAGKPLRYAMEIFETSFGKEYAACFEEVKGLIELLGDIHDADVAADRLKEFLREMCLYNRRVRGRADRMSTGGLRELVRAVREKRARDFTRLCETMKRWREEGFQMRLLAAIGAATAAALPLTPCASPVVATG